ncbi:MBL fold metallo-hydrolase [Herbiconiux sp. CPCC 205716]|uniref:MBL fold metallo-hydrolase n=1 Tax=Herbiconiux gentiana TaxID=2970912 RepID=A0ABT2GES4_9MICO|nr:MBL fold metallo-hydrolase [Herbiconiux gentiana]MCS5714687.1 MBL fold metallo-hydrolase [Herbiconiux gentiana]
MTGHDSATQGVVAGLRNIIRETILTPDFAHWDALREHPAAATKGEVRATFLGVTSVLFDDGVTAILTDGFFSRPSILRLFAGTVKPNKRRIKATFRRANITLLDAVFVNHSHIDHALDSSTIASMTGAWLIGSDSTRELSRTTGFAQERFIQAENGQPIRLGSFTLTPIHAIHSPNDRVPGTIDTPPTRPLKNEDFRTGECYSLFIEHGGKTILMHASANFLPGALAGRRADTVYLGIGTLGKQTDEFREQYWQEVVRAVGATRVVPVHWDNFTRSLNRSLRPLPEPIDNVPQSLRWLERRARLDGIAFAMPRVGEHVDPFTA